MNSLGALFLFVARSSCWTEKGTPHGVHMSSVEGPRENRTEEGTPHVVVGGRRVGREKRLALNSLSLGAPFCSRSKV